MSAPFQSLIFASAVAWPIFVSDVTIDVYPAAVYGPSGVASRDSNVYALLARNADSTQSFVKIYEFSGDSATLVATLNKTSLPDGHTWDLYEIDISADGSTIIVAGRADQNGDGYAETMGIAFIQKVGGTWQWVQQLYTDYATNTNGLSPAISADGSVVAIQHYKIISSQQKPAVWIARKSGGTWAWNQYILITNTVTSFPSLALSPSGQVLWFLDYNSGYYIRKYTGTSTFSLSLSITCPTGYTWNSSTLVGFDDNTFMIQAFKNSISKAVVLLYQNDSLRKEFIPTFSAYAASYGPYLGFIYDTVNDYVLILDTYRQEVVGGNYYNNGSVQVFKLGSGDTVLSSGRIWSTDGANVDPYSSYGAGGIALLQGSAKVIVTSYPNSTPDHANVFNYLNPP